MMKNMKLPFKYDKWSDSGWCIHDADGKWIAEAAPADPGVAEEVARRIVACCNALENVSTEWLEAQSGIVCLGSPIKDRFLELEQQCGQLLAALESFGHKAGCRMNAFGDRCTCGIDAVIASAKGGAA